MNSKNLICIFTIYLFSFSVHSLTGPRVASGRICSLRLLWALLWLSVAKGKWRSGEVEKWRSWERGEDSSPLIKGLSTAKSSKCQISANYCKHRISFSLHSHYFYLLPDFQPWAGKWWKCSNVAVNYWHQKPMVEIFCFIKNLQLTWSLIYFLWTWICSIMQNFPV